MDYFRRKQISAMLLFFALLLPISMVAMEQNNGVFSFKLQDVTVKDIFKYIEKNSEYIFLYSTDKNLLKKINVDVNKKDITQVLDEILKNTTLIYDIDGKQIIIREKNASEKSQQKTTQKKKTIRGIVSDDSTQEPIIGATIRVNGSMTGTTSNIEGDFVLECAVGDTLTVSFVGYQDRSVLVKSGNIYAIALKESAAELGEVVVTAFGVGQKKESLVGSIQQIKPQELKVPSSSLSTAFAGRMAGVIAVQRSGEPGADGANFWIRGKSTFNGNTSALIIMDGVEISSTELNALDPEVIESFSILKDATATALYGTRGANGVMIVATKNGKNLDKPIINFRLEGAISTMTRVPNMVDGPTYMKMFNEAVSRPGCDVSPYSQEKIDGTIAGLNPYIYPNVDWSIEVTKRV
jgi:TonB-dependent SusC/RagA subfamily outer membrane receptor